MRRGDLETRYPLGRDAPAQVTEEQVLHQALSSGSPEKTCPAPRYLLLKAGWGAYCRSSGLGLASPGAAGFTCHYAHCPGTLTNLHNAESEKGRLRFTDLCVELCKTANKRGNLSILGKGKYKVLHFTWKHERKEGGKLLSKAPL